MKKNINDSPKASIPTAEIPPRFFQDINKLNKSGINNFFLPFCMQFETKDE